MLKPGDYVLVRVADDNYVFTYYGFYSKAMEVEKIIKIKIIEVRNNGIVVDVSKIEDVNQKLISHCAYKIITKCENCKK